MAMTPASPKPQHVGTPDPQALNAVLKRYFWWKAQQDLQKRARRLKGRNRAASIKI